MTRSSKLINTLTVVLYTLAFSTCSPGFRNEENDINSFEECATAGYPIMETYPEQCRTPDGRIFVRELQPEGSMGTILGNVLLGPTCPVVQNPPDPNCADKPYQTDLVLTTPDQSKELEKFSSDSYGVFRLEVLPGAYAIRSAAAANILPYCTSNETIQVRANETSDAIVFCDTGIR